MTTPVTTSLFPAIAPKPHVDMTVRSAIGTYERRTPAIATVTLASGDNSPVVLYVGKSEYKAKREAGWHKALVKAIADDKEAVVRAEVRGDVLDLFALESGEPGNNIALRGEGLTTPGSLAGGRLEFVAEEVEYDGAGMRRVWTLGVYKSSSEANALIRTRVMQAIVTQDERARNENRPKRPPHKFRNFPPEEGCAVCGRASTDDAHSVA